MRQPGVNNDQEAYALYINPVTGLMRGQISAQHKILTERIVKLEDMAKTLADTIAAYHHAPAKLSQTERDLLDISERHADGKLTLEQTYQAVYTIVKDNDIRDTDMYEKFLTSYFGETGLNDNIPIPVPGVTVSQQ
jgi:hypothetical protein